jgi:CspA family cold shock protein
MAEGNVKWYDKKKGYGFIAFENGPDVFVHYTSLKEEGTFLNEGDRVIFEIKDGEKGPRADLVALQQDQQA